MVVQNTALLKNKILSNLLQPLQ